MIKSIKIHGLRGFGQERTVQFAIPNNTLGSGLTILVGGNNTGKTTILEALRAFNAPKDNPTSFSEKKRNINCEDGTVHLKLETTENEVYLIDTIDKGSTTTYKKLNSPDDVWWQSPEVFVLQSRRFVDYEFHRSYMDRGDYVRNQQMNLHNRTATIYEFNARLFKMQKNKAEFDKLLKQVLGYDLKWTIEQNENGSYYLKLIVNGCVHSSEGLGDGIWSVFTICDALYDSAPGGVIAIDEPELSLHPAYQKRIMTLFNDYAKDRQIIINTHSPYFVDIHSILNGAYLYRTVKNAEGNIDVFLLSEKSRQSLRGFVKNLNQPHTLGTEAKEIFFLEDNIIVTEGQEDVIMYSKAAELVNMPFTGTFFGWGSGGAFNIGKIVSILNNLGYQKIVAIFDADMPDKKAQLEKEYPMYHCVMIPTTDIRDKDRVDKAAKEGMMTVKGELKTEYIEDMINLIRDANGYFADSGS
jgi:predicted ATP-dependent endonuclease of OLD family